MLPSVINALRLVDEPAPDVPAQVPEVAHPAQVGGTGGTPSPAQVAQPVAQRRRSSLSGIRVSGIRVSLRSIERELNAAGVPYAIRHRVLGSPDGRSRPGSIRHLEKPRNSMTWRVRDSGSLAE